MSLFGVQLNAELNTILTKIRLQLESNEFLPNYRTLYRSFWNYDQELTGSLPPHKFEKVCKK